MNIIDCNFILKIILDFFKNSFLLEIECKAQLKTLN